MKFNEYLEASYVKTNIQLQMQYTVSAQAKTLAFQKLITAQRNILVFLSYPVILLQYLLTTIRILKQPLPAAELIADYNAKSMVRIQAAKEKEEELRKVASQLGSSVPPIATTSIDVTK